MQSRDVSVSYKRSNLLRGPLLATYTPRQGMSMSRTLLLPTVPSTNLKPVCHPLYPELAASLDGVTCAAEGVNHDVEIKCLHTDKLLKKIKPVHV
eukprot:18117-Heterococcus_DN1.PRE.1